MTFKAFDYYCMTCNRAIPNEDVIFTPLRYDEPSSIECYCGSGDLHEIDINDLIYETDYTFVSIENNLEIVL